MRVGDNNETILMTAQQVQKVQQVRHCVYIEQHLFSIARGQH